MKRLLNYQSPPVTGFSRWMYKAGGGDHQILACCSYSDHVKYFCLGGIVLMTGVLASLSGGFAFYTIFSPKAIESPEQIYPIWVAFAAIFGLFWGYIIFNLDRYIVASTGKGDGTDAITGRELRNALPRIILGAIIAITISKPLEVRMFQSEIDAQLNIKRIAFRDSLRAGVDSKYKDLIEKQETEKTAFRTERAKRQEEANKLQEQYVQEARIITVGPRAKALKAEVDRKEAEIKEIDIKMADIETQIKKLTDNREAERNKQEGTAKMLDGLLERIKIADEIGGWITTFITLLFLALELTPIFFKLMIIKSPYDYLEENVHAIIKAREAIEIRPEYYKPDANGKAVDYTIFYVPDQIIAEQAEIVAKQKELSKKIVGKWAETEGDQIDKDPEKYIKRDEE